MSESCSNFRVKAAGLIGMCIAKRERVMKRRAREDAESKSWHAQSWWKRWGCPPHCFYPSIYGWFTVDVCNRLQKAAEYAVAKGDGWVNVTTEDFDHL